MTLAEWCEKYKTRLLYEVNPINNCTYHFLYIGGDTSYGKQGYIELFHLTDYHVSAACGMVIYLVPRTIQQLENQDMK